MKIIIKPLLLVFVAAIFIQCNKDKYTIAKGKVGQITTETKIKDLETIFAKDSIVKILSEGQKGSDNSQDDDEYLIYKKGGKHLLTIVPKEQLDVMSTVKSIEIFDGSYKTEAGVTINSNFEQINTNCKISNIETSFLSAILFIDELNVTITIDKEELGLKGFNMQKVNLDQIPDLAKIKSLVVWFD